MRPNINKIKDYLAEFYFLIASIEDIFLFFKYLIIL